MPAPRLLSIFILVLGVSPAWAQPIVIDFEGIADAGGVCAAGLTGGGAPVEWQLVEDPTAPAGPMVLAELSGDRTSARFPLCILPAPSAANVDVAVAFTAIAGTVDQAAGLMVRVLDEDNYYIARANALEGNVRFYKVEGGVRTQLAGVDIPVSANAWHQLGLRIEGDAITVTFDTTVLFTATDRTFTAAGRVGVWTKADSLTHFDALTVTVLP